jgi:acetylornithine/N-succinyldiaminopimelate aminotransferase
MRQNNLLRADMLHWGKQWFERHVMKQDPIAIENARLIPFFNRIPVVVERGEGVHVWDDAGKRYFDFTSGWGVTCIGHANPVITNAIVKQAGTIMATPNAGQSYSRVRAELLDTLAGILPAGLTRIFFGSNGAEVNDAAIKLSRKVSGRMVVISASAGFHGRTTSSASATGLVAHRETFNPALAGNVFVPYDDLDAIGAAMNSSVAAVILEPLLGEGGVIVPDPGYLAGVSKLCRNSGAFLIVDEVQTGFCRTGPMFASARNDVAIDFLTMAKGIAGGFPFAAFAVTESLALRFEKGDHGGTYCGNPLGCAVSLAVIRYLLDNDVSDRVQKLGNETLSHLAAWQSQYPGIVTDVRGKGLLLAIEFSDAKICSEVFTRCLENGLILNVVRGRIIRLFPALTITHQEMLEALAILKRAIDEKSSERVLRGDK